VADRRYFVLFLFNRFCIAKMNRDHYVVSGVFSHFNNIGSDRWVSHNSNLDSFSMTPAKALSWFLTGPKSPDSTGIGVLLCDGTGCLRTWRPVMILWILPYVRGNFISHPRRKWIKDLWTTPIFHHFLLDFIFVRTPGVLSHIYWIWRVAWGKWIREDRAEKRQNEQNEQEKSFDDHAKSEV